MANFDYNPKELIKQAKIRAGTYKPEDEQGDYLKRLNALSSVGIMAGNSIGGTSGGALSGAGQGAAIGSAFAPGIGTAIGAGIGALAGGIGAGIQGGKEEEQAKNILDLKKREMALAEKQSQEDQFNKQRQLGLSGLDYLAGQRSNAIQSRNKSLFKNDLMRVIGGR